MTAAVIRATYADWKLVKTRSAVQLVFEIDTAQADLAYKVLGGMPQTGDQIEVAIARLKATEPESTLVRIGDDDQPVSLPAAVSPPVSAAVPPSRPAEGQDKPAAKSKQPWKSMTFTTRAAIICGEPEFWEWTTHRPFHINGGKATDGATAAVWLRARTAVNSRKEYDTDEASGRRYLSIESAYLAWKNDRERYGT